MIVRGVARIFATLWFFLFAACGLEAGGVGGGTNGEGGPADATVPDTSQRDAATVDAAREAGAPTIDARPDTSETDAPAPLDSGNDTLPSPDAADASAPDTGFVFTCGKDTTDNCATCAGNIVGCLWCAGGSLSAAFCIPVGGQCDEDHPPGAKGQACPCDLPDPSTCLGPNQVCYDDKGTGYCVTCGQGGTDGYACQGGGTCDKDDATCE
jgi:hypothetical protein